MFDSLKMMGTSNYLERCVGEITPLRAFEARALISC